MSLGGPARSALECDASSHRFIVSDARLFVKQWIIDVENAGLTSSNRAGLRITVAKTTRALEALAGRASHDLDGDRRYAAFHSARFGHRNFFRLHAAVEHQDIALDRGGLGVSMQQNRGGDRGHVA